MMVKATIETGVIAILMRMAVFALGVSVFTMHRIILCIPIGEFCNYTRER